MADYASTRGVKGSITGDGVLGQVRAPNLHGSAYVFKPKIPAVAMAAAGVSLLDTYGVTVPAGKKLVTRSWNINVPVNATLVIGGHVFTSNLAAEPNGSYKSTERYVITDNSAGSSDVNTEFNVSIRNLAGSVLNVPAGYSADIYLAVE